MPTKKQLEEADRMAATIDWSALTAMSDEEIYKKWSSDADTTWPSDKELAEFDLVIPAASRRKPPKEAAE